MAESSSLLRLGRRMTGVACVHMMTLRSENGTKVEARRVAVEFSSNLVERLGRAEACIV
jgi:hypothetical protein